MKPHMVKRGGQWQCWGTFRGVLGHRYRSFGFGATPAEAYRQWLEHWGNKR